MTDPDLFGGSYRACLFDMDGVLTDTASTHSSAWKLTFDELLRQRAETEGQPFVPFDIGRDYLSYVDGKPRAAGVRDFLASRSIQLPEGDPSDGPDEATVHGIGTRKNALVLELLEKNGVDVYEDARTLLLAVREAGMHTAVVSSSANTVTVLQAADMLSLMDERMDGVIAAREGIPGKPAPDTFIAAAAKLGVDVTQAVVFEDAIAGVRAGRAGGFGLVIGVDRVGQHDALLEAGADVAVSDLTDLISRQRS